MCTKTMMIYEADYNNQKTFKLLLVSKDCPFTLGIYDVTPNMLALVSKDKAKKLDMIPKLDNNEHYIENIDDIKAFLEVTVINPKHKSIKILDDVKDKPEQVKKKVKPSMKVVKKTKGGK